MLHVFSYYRSLGYRILWSLTSPKAPWVKKNRLPLHRRNFRSDKIPRKYATPWCKQEWNIVFQVPARFGGKSHGRPDLKREKITTRPIPFFQLNFNVYSDVDDREKAEGRDKVQKRRLSLKEKHEDVLLAVRS